MIGGRRNGERRKLHELILGAVPSAISQPCQIRLDLCCDLLAKAEAPAPQYGLRVGTEVGFRFAGSERQGKGFLANELAQTTVGAAPLDRSAHAHDHLLPEFHPGEVLRRILDVAPVSSLEKGRGPLDGHDLPGRFDVGSGYSGTRQKVPLN